MPPLAHQSHNAYQLVQSVIEVSKVIVTKIEDCSDYVISACNQLRRSTSAYDSRSILQRLGKEDASNVAPREMTYLLQILSKILFQQSQLRFDFRWNPNLFRDRGALGQTWLANGKTLVSIIEMDPYICEIIPPFGNLNSRAISRLSTLIHELIHVFLDQFACTRCETYMINVVDLEGHARMWEELARHIKFVAEHGLSLPLSLNRFANPTDLG